MNTRRIYQDNVYSTSCEAEITGIDLTQEHALLTFDATVFFPEGGGQSSDVGTVILLSGEKEEERAEEKGRVINIIHVFEEAGAVFHETDLPVPEDPDELPFWSGARVLLSIDWEHRFDNMQRHLGEHILSGAIHRLYGGINKGFHMGADFITIDIGFPEDAPGGYDRMTWEMAEAAEAEANRIIWQDLPVRVDYFPTRNEAAVMPLRKALAFDENISIVTVGDPAEAPADCVACCGTHPSSSGQVGILKIYKIEPNKGLSRIYFECGGRAYRQYRQDFNTLYDIETDLSAGRDDLAEKYRARAAHYREIGDELRTLRKYIAESEKDAILSSADELQIRRYKNLSVNDLMSIGKKAGKKVTGLILLVHDPTHTVLLFSDGSERFDCGTLVKNLTPSFGGRGGGKAGSARVSFKDKNSLRNFLEAVSSSFK